MDRVNWANRHNQCIQAFCDEFQNDLEYALNVNAKCIINQGLIEHEGQIRYSVSILDGDGMESDFISPYEIYDPYHTDEDNLVDYLTDLLMKDPSDENMAIIRARVENIQVRANALGAKSRTGDM